MKKVKLIFLMVAGLLLLAASPALAEEQGTTVRVGKSNQGEILINSAADAQSYKDVIVNDSKDGKYFIGVKTYDPNWEFNGIICVDSYGRQIQGTWERESADSDNGPGPNVDGFDVNAQIISIPSGLNVDVYPVFVNRKDVSNWQTSRAINLPARQVEEPEPEFKIQVKSNPHGETLISYQSGISEYYIDFYNEVYNINEDGEYALGVKPDEGWAFDSFVCLDAEGNEVKEAKVVELSSMEHPGYGPDIEGFEHHAKWIYIPAGINATVYPVYKNLETGELVYSDETPVDPVDPVDPIDPVDPVKPEPTVTPAGNEETQTQITTKTESTNPKTGIQEEMLWGAAAVISVAALAVVARKRLVRKK